MRPLLRPSARLLPFASPPCSALQGSLPERLSPGYHDRCASDRQFVSPGTSVVTTSDPAPFKNRRAAVRAVLLAACCLAGFSDGAARGDATDDYNVAVEFFGQDPAYRMSSRTAMLNEDPLIEDDY